MWRGRCCAVVVCICKDPKLVSAPLSYCHETFGVMNVYLCYRPGLKRARKFYDQLFSSKSATSSCLVDLNSECTSFILTDPILIVGGSGYGGYKDTVELLSLGRSRESRRLTRFPKKLKGAVGTTLGEFFVIDNILPNT